MHEFQNIVDLKTINEVSKLTDYFRNASFKEYSNLLHECIELKDHSSLLENDANRLYLRNLFVKIFDSFAITWSKIFQENFSQSWNSLQDTVDSIDLFCKFVENPPKVLSCIQRQLHSLESAYPYQFFVSPGMFVEHYDCSICGNNSLSPDCVHLPGWLYHGQVAHLIARGISTDHLAFVNNPADKRCVEVIPNDDFRFKPLKNLSYHAQNTCNFVTRLIEVKPIYGKSMVKRNDQCHCGSGLKFKKCCINTTHGRLVHLLLELANTDVISLNELL
jgi:hypothetical protein